MKTGVRSREPGVRGQWPAIALLSWLALWPSSAAAHRLEAEAVVRPGWKVQVESWFETGDAAAGARVEVFGPDGQPHSQGRLDRQGVYQFAYRSLEPLRVVVNAGGGHRVEVKVAAKDLVRSAVGSTIACVQPTPSPWLVVPMLGHADPEPDDSAPAPAPVVHRRTGIQWLNLTLGLALLLALAALVKQRLRVRQLRSQLEQAEKPEPR